MILPNSSLHHLLFSLPSVNGMPNKISLRLSKTVHGSYPHVKFSKEIYYTALYTSVYRQLDHCELLLTSFHRALPLYLAFPHLAYLYFCLAPSSISCRLLLLWCRYQAALQSRAALHSVAPQGEGCCEDGCYEDRCYERVLMIKTYNDLTSAAISSLTGYITIS